jgi:hypothetical protein
MSFLRLPDGGPRSFSRALLFQPSHTELMSQAGLSPREIGVTATR